MALMILCSILIILSISNSIASSREWMTDHQIEGSNTLKDHHWDENYRQFKKFLCGRKGYPIIVDENCVENNGKFGEEMDCIRPLIRNSESNDHGDPYALQWVDISCEHWNPNQMIQLVTDDGLLAMTFGRVYKKAFCNDEGKLVVRDAEDRLGRVKNLRCELPEE
ncbi:hypothetical protein WR25_00177 [Diploscapter pachys]|uniref:C-type lectin domain-containing protein n=1 Tax=Diploscapter pachys TaxID=2018661 RepID=A0A2A2JM12_9BILA|nr:hypothetical protein WR25_00177 [Diploscapter pachys]